MTLSFGWSRPSPSRREEQDWRRAVEPLLDSRDPRGLIIQADRVGDGWSIYITISDSQSRLEPSAGESSSELQLKVSYWYLKEKHPLAQQILAALNAAGRNVTLAPLPPVVPPLPPTAPESDPTGV
jgi:hypothetical protein